ncbi:MAG: SusE domain-containing protein [Bacteroidales bacterium]|nr:SusE domain-containing protein [Bacteroidales bacterium]
MKKYLILLTAMLLSVCGCKKAALPAVTLSSDQSEVSVTSYSSAILFTLSWELSGGSAAIGQTYVQFCTDKEFVSPYVLKSSGNSFVVTGKDLKKIQETFGVLEDYELIVRLLVEGENVPSVYSNKVRINVDIP